jgi:hypothetical protein
MRATWVVAVLLLSACAGERLAVNPPPGVDFSGKWTLNAADSDDPMHLMQAQNAAADKQKTQSAQGRSSRRGPGGAPPGLGGPASPAMGALGAPLRWPGKDLEVKQVAGVVAFTSDARNRVCQPESERAPAKKPDPRDRDALPANRDDHALLCGWMEATLVVRAGEGEEERGAGYEEHYDLSQDRQRLVETIVFRGGRSNGYTLSRVWDRVVQ